MTQTTLDRLMARTTPGAGGCILWTGALKENGYGATKVLRDGRWHSAYAHRVAYECANGPIPPGLVVRHACDVRNCVAPDHLLIGTKADNTRDMLERNRQGLHMRSRPDCRKCGAEEWGVRQNGTRWCRPCNAQAVAAGYRRRKAGSPLAS